MASPVVSPDALASLFREHHRWLLARLSRQMRCRWDADYTYTNFCHSGRAYPTRTEACHAGGVNDSYASNHIPPRAAGALTLGTHLFEQRLTAGTRVSYTGHRPMREAGASLIPVVDWGSYVLVDVFANYRLNDHVAVDLTVDNLTDRYYMDAMTLGLMASPGRTVRLGFTVNF
ncbi:MULTISPECIES: TonB-dependent receptor domain-containing protein [Stenotrophomonas]|jgi:hemoglobin/transferrin/lactoferrin receptor protein|uniref:TonB-dependent receptor n=1 Tax=Stenotrophomonas maltophilia TaxID=40324 RepID=A0A4S2CUV5_STEMA|nr:MULTISPECIES: TonB-dependent receptor [Stenotrophomonas]TGY32346.1 TonB-dependent receptor [Stenotrophomonas maltophilia]